METETTTLVQNCHKAAYTGEMSFPEIIGTLVGAGFEGYSVDFRCASTTYFSAGGEPFVLQNPATDKTVAPSFDASGIVAQIRWAQSNPPDYSYAAFCKHIKALGCAGYHVSFLGRRVLYFGRTAETHTEYFP